MEENPYNMVEDAPAGAKKRSSNILPLVIAVLVCAAMAGAIMLMRGGCSNSATTKLKMEALRANEGCPVDYGNGMTLQSVVYDEASNVVTMTVAVDNESFDMDYLRTNADVAKKNVYLSFSQGDCKPMVNDIANGGAGFKVVLKDKKGGKTVDVLLSPDEVKQMSKSNLSQAEIGKMKFDNWLLVQNRACPQDLGDGTAIAKVVAEEGFVVLYIQGEDNETIDYIRDDSDYYNFMKSNMMSGLAEDVATQSQFALLASNGYGLVFRFYHDDPKKSADITYSVDELQKAMQKKESGYTEEYLQEYLRRLE